MATNMSLAINVPQTDSEIGCLTFYLLFIFKLNWTIRRYIVLRKKIVNLQLVISCGHNLVISGPQFQRLGIGPLYISSELRWPYFVYFVMYCTIISSLIMWANVVNIIKLRVFLLVVMLHVNREVLRHALTNITVINGIHAFSLWVNQKALY